MCVWYCVRSSYIIKSEDPTAMINQFCAWVLLGLIVAQSFDLDPVIQIWTLNFGETLVVGLV